MNRYGRFLLISLFMTKIIYANELMFRDALSPVSIDSLNDTIVSLRTDLSDESTQVPNGEFNLNEHELSYFSVLWHAQLKNPGKILAISVKKILPSSLSMLVSAVHTPEISQFTGNLKLLFNLAMQCENYLKIQSLPPEKIIEKKLFMFAEIYEAGEFLGFGNYNVQDDTVEDDDFLQYGKFYLKILSEDYFPVFLGYSKDDQDSICKKIKKSYYLNRFFKEKLHSQIRETTSLLSKLAT